MIPRRSFLSLFPIACFATYLPSTTLSQTEIRNYNLIIHFLKKKGIDLSITNFTRLINYSLMVFNSVPPFSIYSIEHTKFIKRNISILSSIAKISHQVQPAKLPTFSQICNSNFADEFYDITQKVRLIKKESVKLCQ